MRRPVFALAILWALTLPTAAQVPSISPYAGPLGSISPYAGPLGSISLPPTMAPTVTSVSPNSGPTTGGTPVTITGINFVGATAVHFGVTTATFFVFSGGIINATAPAHALGTIDVTVTNAVGTSATSAADQFTYTSCTNSLDFSQACNSQYFTVF